MLLLPACLVTGSLARGVALCDSRRSPRTAGSQQAARLIKPGSPQIIRAAAFRDGNAGRRDDDDDNSLHVSLSKTARSREVLTMHKFESVVLLISGDTWVIGVRVRFGSPCLAEAT